MNILRYVRSNPDSAAGSISLEHGKPDPRLKDDMLVNQIKPLMSY